MKKLILTTFLATVAFGAIAQAKTVPYSTDLATKTAIDSEWAAINAGSGNSWQPDITSTYPNSITGTNGGVSYSYHYENAGDAWLISPAIALEAGKDYTVITWAKTMNYDEKWKVTLASGATVDDQKAGKIVIDKTSGYKNSGDFERIAGVFTVEQSGEYHFGLNCCSDANQYNLFISGFSIVEGNVAVLPEPEYDLPYVVNFSNAETAAKMFNEWTSFEGENANSYSTQKWTLSTYGGFAKFSSGYDTEDCWFISPALNVVEAGKYAIKAQVATQGLFDVCIGTNKEDITTFTTISEFDTQASSKEELISLSTDITTAGKYYIAFHAKASSGSWYGYEIYNVTVKADVPTPAVITDLAAVVDDDALTVDLSWTNPDLNSYGEALDAITKVEVLRNNTVIATLNPEVGSTSTYKDQLTTAGVCSYKVLVYGEKGLNDAEPMILKLGYVGHPTSTLPYAYNMNSDGSELELWTVYDANNDGNTWAYDPNASFPTYISEREAGVEADDYLTTPYFDLTAGYYRITYEVDAKENSFELGYATNRRDVANTFVKCGEVLNCTTFDHDIIISIPADGRYCFVWHHIGGFSSSYYNYAELSEVSIQEQMILPDVATDLKAVSAEDYSLMVTLSWINPALDNAGNPLQEISHAIIYRDDVEIGRTTETLIPGQPAQYVDNDIPTSGDHTYKVEIYNENGCSEAEAPTAVTFVGMGLMPYSTTDFSEWTLVALNGSKNWATQYDGSLNAFQSGSPLDCYALSPYLGLTEGTYKVTVTTKLYNADNHTGWQLVIGSDVNDLTTMQVITSVITTTTEKQINEFILKTEDVQPTTEDALVVPVGRSVIGIHANTEGDIYLLGFSIEKDYVSGIESAVADNNGISFVNGMICFNGEVSSVAIVDLAGRVIYSAKNGKSIDTTEFGSGLVIVTAIVNGKTCALKVVL